MQDQSHQPIRTHDGAFFGVCLPNNILKDALDPRTLPGDERNPARRVVVWSGSTSDELFPGPGTHSLNWTPSAWSAFTAAAEQLIGTLVRSGVAEVLVRTHHAHVVSDAPSVRRLAEWAGSQDAAVRARVMLDPLAMLTHEQTADPEVVGLQLERFAGALRGVPRIDAVVVPRDVPPTVERAGLVRLAETLGATPVC